MGIWLLENDILRTNYCCIWCREISLKLKPKFPIFDKSLLFTSLNRHKLPVFKTMAKQVQVV